jgi:hypothetical protein
MPHFTPTWCRTRARRKTLSETRAESNRRGCQPRRTWARRKTLSETAGSRSPRTSRGGRTRARRKTLSETAQHVHGGDGRVAPGLEGRRCLKPAADVGPLPLRRGRTRARRRTLSETFLDQDVVIARPGSHPGSKEDVEWTHHMGQGHFGGHLTFPPRRAGDCPIPGC